MHTWLNNKMLLKIIVGLVLLLVFGKAFAGLFHKKSSKSDAQDTSPLQQLAFLENAVANDHEILRLSGYPAGSIRFIPANNTFIIPTSLRFNAWVNLWRINPDGLVVDSFSPDGEYEGTLPSSGIFFRKENYIDWAFTGDKLPKHYVKTLDAKLLGKEKTAAVLAQAQQVVWKSKTYYEQIYRGSKETHEFQYFLKTSDGWSILLSPDELTLTDYPSLKFSLREELVKEYQSPDLGVKIVDSMAFDVKNPESPIQLLLFKKLGESKSSFMDINGSAWVGDYGLGHFQLRADNEPIEFKSFHRILKSGIGEGKNTPDMNFYDLEKIIPNNDLRFLILNTGRAPSRDDIELGSYIIRKKITEGMTLKLTRQEQSFVENSQKKFSLSVNIKGLEAVESNLYWFTYFNGKSETFGEANTWATAAAPRSIPMEVRGSFDLPVKPEKNTNSDKNEKDKKAKNKKPDNKYYSFALKLNDQYFTWSDVSNIHYALHFDYLELEKAFRELYRPDETINFLLNFNFVPGGVELSVRLSNSTKSYTLQNVRFASVASQEMSKKNSLFIFDQKMINALSMIRAVHKPYGLDGPPAEKIPAALALMRQVINESEHPEQLDYAVKDASWFLLNGAISAKDAQLKLDVINNYVVHLFPKTGVSAGLVDFVRRAVDLGITAPNEELLDNINNAFFNPKTNANYDKDQWLLENGMLDQSFKTAMFNSIHTDNYIWLSSKVFANNMGIERLSPIIANHYTKLLIKSLQEKNYALATRLSEKFIDSIYSTIGYSEKSTDVISSIIVVGLVTKNEKLLDRVMSQFINNPDYKKSSNEILYYNVACYYAAHGDKANMLSAIKSSIEYGHDTATFINDSDFEAFKNDPEFIAITNVTTEVNKK